MRNTWIWKHLLDAGFAVAAAHGVAEWFRKPAARQAVTELYELATTLFALDHQVCLMPRSFQRIRLRR